MDRTVAGASRDEPDGKSRTHIQKRSYRQAKIRGDETIVAIAFTKALVSLAWRFGLGCRDTLFTLPWQGTWEMICNLIRIGGGVFIAYSREAARSTGQRRLRADREIDKKKPVNSTQQGPIAKTISLLLDPKVQKELQLATPQLRRIKESVDSLKESFMPRIRKVQSLSDSEKSNARPKLMRDVIWELDSILEKAMRPEQVTRFQQIRLQKEGIAAFFDETVRDGLDLSPEQGAQIKSILQDGVRKISAAQRGTPGNRAQLVAEAQKKTEDAILGALSTEQAARWNAMRGAPFSFESTGGPARDTSAMTLGGPKNTGMGREIESTRMAGRGTAGPGMSGPGSGGPSAVARYNDP